MHSNETPDNDRNISEVSASEVPINHMMDINDSDSDFDDDSSDDDNHRDYELLAAQMDNTDAQQTVYYPHNYNVEWIDWDQYDLNQQQQQQQQQQLQQQSSTTAESNRIDANDSQQTSNETTVESHTTDPSLTLPDESLSQSQTIPLTDDRITVIKSLMSNFILPKDNIPVWANDLPDDEWKAFLSRKLDSN